MTYGYCRFNAAFQELSKKLLQEMFGNEILRNTVMKVYQSFEKKLFLSLAVQFNVVYKLRLLIFLGRIVQGWSKTFPT